MGVNKIIYGGNTLIDLSGDTVDAAHLSIGYTAHGADGNGITGTLKGQTLVPLTVTPTKDAQVFEATRLIDGYVPVTIDAIPAQYVDTSDADAGAGDITRGKIAYVKGNKIIGTNTGGGGPPSPIVAGDTPVKGSVDAGTEIQSTSWTSTGLSISITTAGTYRFKWCAETQTATNGNPGHTRLYKNNSAVGTDHIITSAGNHAFTEDVSCSAGDTVVLRAQAARTISTYAIKCSGLIACIDWDNGL